MPRPAPVPPPAPAPLAGRPVLVTGAGRRIGAAIASRLAAAGCHVALHHHRSGTDARRLAKALARTHGIEAAAVQADLALAADRARLVEDAAEALGRPLTALVNGASRFAESRLADLTLEGLHAAVAVDAWAPLEIGMSLARQLPRGASGAIVNFLDARIVDDDRRHVAYFLAKRMLGDLTRLMALEMAPRVAVNAVAPGPTLPPPGTPAAEGARLMERLRRRLPLQRTPEPSDLAEAVAYLLSSRAHTGQVLFVDGGRHLGRPPS